MHGILSENVRAVGEFRGLILATMSVHADYLAFRLHKLAHRSL